MFVNKLKMNSIAEAVKQVTEKEDSCKDEVKKHEKRLHGKDGEVSQHVDKMHKEESELAEAEKVMTPTGMKVYGSSYGDSAKARRDQVKKEIDTLKGPKAKDMMQKDKEDHIKTKGRYDEAAKPDFLDLDGDKNEKESMKKAASDKKMKEDTEFKNRLIEALKGKQHKIDKNKNNKIDAQDFAILRGQQKEEVNEREMTDAEMAKREKIVKGMKKSLAGFKARYGERAKNVMYATANKQAMKEESVEEEIDPKVRTKDTLKGQEVTSQSDDVGPNSNGRSTKVKFRGGPMKEGVELNEVSKSEFEHHFHNWTNSEHAPYNSDAGDDNKVHQSALQYLRSTNVPKENHEKLAMHIADKFHGSGIHESTPPKNTDIADKSYLKDMGKKPTVKSDLKNFKNFLTGKKETNEGKQPESDTVPFVTNAAQPPFDGPYKKVKSTVTDKSGAQHTPMSRAKDLARAAMKRIKTEMLGKAPGNNG